MNGLVLIVLTVWECQRNQIGCVFASSLQKKQTFDCIFLLVMLPTDVAFTDARTYTESCTNRTHACEYVVKGNRQAYIPEWYVQCRAFYIHVTQQGRADKSPQQWRQTWTSARSSRANFMFFSFLMNGLWHDKVGAMLLRALVHFGNAPLAFSSAIFDCALGRRGMTWATWVPTCWRWRNSRSLARLCKLPPDDIPGSPCLKRDFWAWGGHHISSEHD